MKPYVMRAGSLGSDVVIVLDASITTQSVDGGQTRFAREVDGGARSRRRSATGQVGQSYSAGWQTSGPARRQHRSRRTATVLSSQQPGFEQPDVADAMNLADALATRAGSAKAAVLLLRSADTAAPSPQAGMPYRDQPYGSAGAPNLGIDSLVAAQTATGPCLPRSAS